MKKPLIGITPSRTISESGLSRLILFEFYSQAVQHAGGLPVLIPLGLSESDYDLLFNYLDGILLSGGGDIDINLYNGKPHPRVASVDRDRDTMELYLARLAARTGKPTLGICRGIQVMNVALGGKLFTDIADQMPDALKHDYFPDLPRDLLAHDVLIEPASRLAEILALSEMKVNSMHHQGIEQTAAGLVATAYAPDGLIEAFEMPNHPFWVGIQWHPECLPNSLPNQALFRAFVQASESETVHP